MNDLLLIRHGSTALNETNRYQGSWDATLSDLGRHQARLLRERLSGRIGKGERIWTSDLQRARQTTRLAFPESPRKEDPRLRELDFGVFDGRTYRENLARHGDGFLEWLDAPDRVPPPGGESLGSFRARLRSWLDDAGVEARTIVVTHGGPVRMILSILTGVGFERLRRWSVHPASVLRLGRERGVWRPTPISEDAKTVDLESLGRILKEER